MEKLVVESDGPRGAELHTVPCRRQVSLGLSSYVKWKLHVTYAFIREADVKSQKQDRGCLPSAPHTVTNSTPQRPPPFRAPTVLPEQGAHAGL